MDEHECSKLYYSKKYLLEMLNLCHCRATIDFGIPYPYFKNVSRETTAFSVTRENAYLSISNAMVIETAGMEAMKKIVD